MFIPVVIHKDEGSVFGVTVPDIPGCHSWGDTMEQALENTRDAIYGHVETLLKAGAKVDIHVSHMADLKQSGAYADAECWAMLELDLSRLDATPERVNISLPRFVLHRIDEYIASRRETRSGFLARAALAEIAKEG